MTQDDSRAVDNPWRTFIENVMNGDNFFRRGEYYELLSDLDSGYRAKSLLAEAEADRDSWSDQAAQRLKDWDDMRIERDALQSRLDAVAALADRWEMRSLDVDSYADSAEDRMVSVCLNSAATELRAALGGESRGNEEDGS